jgi:hypothetical protein
VYINFGDFPAFPWDAGIAPLAYHLLLCDNVGLPPPVLVGVPSGGFNTGITRKLEVGLFTVGETRAVIYSAPPIISQAAEYNFSSNQISDAI